MLAAFSPSDDMQITVVLGESSRGLALTLGSRWKKPVARVQTLEESQGALSRLLSGPESDVVVLASLSAVCLIDAQAFQRVLEGCTEELQKISVSRTPIEMYCARRSRVTALLGESSARGTKGGSTRDRLFGEILHPAIDLIADVPGELLFHNNLMDYYERNIWVVANFAKPSFNAAISRLPELADDGGESHVSEKGLIRDSFLSSGVEVEGTVDGSIIFPHVSIRKNSLVSRSVVLSGNRIGTGTEVHRSLILPYSSEAPRTGPNIGDNCVIGAKSSTARNADYPDHLHDGITLVGMDAEIPNGFRAEAASLIGPGVPASALRKLKVLRKGTCALARHAGPAEHAR